GTTDYDGTHNLNEYYVWQYAKENTIPGAEVQDHGISTGVVFKGEITGAAVEAANGEMIYVFENVLYGNWAAVEAAAIADNAPATLVAAVNKIKAIETPAAADYAAAGFTGYNPDKKDSKYYAYYYYWNRHNDNGDNTEMGPMEFAVVRNNVYKLCVDKIAKFGHPDPTDPENPDPDPVDPDDPDEEINYYFTVTVKVLPWVVRVNHIEF
ncbi:MAG: fimbria major subunit, partial [Bacteroidales bacterium]|nr:fimbria major subunit [Bacteroidales bacterium]